MTDVLIKRELLERANSLLCSYSSTLTDRAVTRRAISEICAILAAPRQTEGEGLKVVAWQDAENPLYTTAERRVLHDWVNNGYPIVELCRLSDAQRAIAELQAKLDDPDYPPKYSRRLIAELREELDAAKEILAQQGRRNTELRAERDTLRQQLAELDAEILEQCRLNGMGAERELKLIAKRDKLAGLLREKFPRIDPENPYPLDEVEHHCEYTLYQERERLHREIDAALAEVFTG